MRASQSGDPRNAQSLLHRSSHARHCSHASRRNLPCRCRQLRHRPVHHLEVEPGLLEVRVRGPGKDRRLPQVRPRAPRGVDPGAGSGASRDHGQGACAPRERASRPLGRQGRGLEVPEALRAQLQEDDARRRRAGTARREAPVGALDAPSGPDRPGAPCLPGRDLREDEYGAAQGGWGPKGARLPGPAPFGHWNTSPLIAALRHDRIDAPWVFDGPVNGEVFLTWVARELVPTMNAGDLIVMDNLACHKNARVLRAIRAAGAHVLFLSPYGPDLNPIEQAFAKMKHRLRNAAARSRETLWRTVGEVLEDIEP